MNKEKVGLRDNFFESGGHSLMAMRLLSLIHQQLNTKLELKDLYKNSILENQARLIDQLGKAIFKPIERVNIQQSYPISHAQRRLWVLSQFKGVSSVYNMPGSIEIDGEYKIEIFQKVFNRLFERHEILRTVLKENSKGELRQWVLDVEQTNFKVTFEDLRKSTDSKQLAFEKIDIDSKKEFDFSTGPLLRSALFQINEFKFIFYFNMHHIISDGWSMDILAKEIFDLYEAYSNNKELILPELKIQYKDYASWQLKQLSGDSFGVHRNYWQERLAGDLPIIDLPSEKIRPKIKTYLGRGLKTFISPKDIRALKLFCKENDGSLFIGLLAVWNVLCYKYTSQQDIIVGKPVAGRDHVDLENQIGFYVNMIALRNKVNLKVDFVDFFNTVKIGTLDGYKHQMYPFDRLVEDLNLTRDISRSALFDILLDFHNSGNDETKEGVGENDGEEIIDIGEIFVKYDLEFHFWEVKEEILIQVNFNSDIYSQELINSLLKHFKSLLSFILREPNIPIGKTEYLLEGEKLELLNSCSPGLVENDHEENLIDLFRKQVKGNPDNIAVQFEGNNLTYFQLEELSNQFANCLKDNYNVKENDLVGLLIDNSEWVIVFILGILKIGACYIPIDPTYPKDRKSGIFKNSNLKLLITETNYLFDIDYYEGKMFAHDIEFNPMEYAKTPVNFIPSKNNLAYVIYTSGSTGIPKGVMIEHGALTNYLNWGLDQYLENGTQNSDFGLFTSLSFDLTVTSLFLPLISGGKLSIFSSFKDVSVVLEEYFGGEISCIKLTPAHINLVKNIGLSGSNIEMVIVGGDVLNWSHVEILKNLNPSIKIYNEYGPTEATVGCTSFLVNNEKEEINIGRPIKNTKILILDSDNNLVPKGVEGEICIGGEGLARGYLNSENLTSKKFIENPFSKGEVIYKSGDLGCWLANDEIKYFGRRDNQVKIRGYRVELEEIEKCVLKNNDISEAVVLVRGKGDENIELVAYIVATNLQDVTQLRKCLADSLPDYMIPNHFVQLESLPLTNNGKVDKKSLPNVDGTTLVGNVEYLEPRNEVEEKIIDIWKSVFTEDRIGVKNDFFVLGGHSLKAVKIIGEYHKNFDVKLTLAELFTHTTVESHANLINNSKSDSYNDIPLVEEASCYQISDAQRRLWILSQFDKASVAYNMPFHLSIEGDFNFRIFENAVLSIVDRHETLRTVFRLDDTKEVKQFILSREEIGFRIDFVDFGSKKNNKEVVKSYLEEDNITPFDLVNGPLLRVGVIKLAEKLHIVYFNMHHIISDGWSIEVLKKEILEYYNTCKAGKKPNLPSLKIQYKDYSNWSLNRIGNNELIHHKEFWMDQLSGDLPTLKLPSNKKRPKVKTYAGNRLSTYIPSDLTNGLKSYGQKEGGSLFIGLLAVWNILLYRYSFQKDIIIGTPMAGRDHPSLDNQIGFYVNTLALRNKINPNRSFEQFYNQVKESALLSFEHQNYPFDRLVEELNLNRDTSRNAVFDIMLMLQNMGEREMATEPDELSMDKIVDYGEGSSKFDLDIIFQEIGEFMSFDLIYNEDVYDGELIRGLMTHFKQLLTIVLKNPSEKIDSFYFLNKDEQSKILISFNNTSCQIPPVATIVDLFEKQAILAANKVGVVFGKVSLTYQEINELSNKFARFLNKQYNVEKSDFVGISLDRSENYVIVLLGILKARACCVPIDSDSPKDRLKYTLEDSGCKILVGNKEWKHFEEKQNEFSSKNLKHKPSPEDLAYVIYTSGSTGLPKGCILQNKGIVNHIFSKIDMLHLDVNTKWCHTSKMYFVGGIWQLWAPLSVGGSLILTNKKELIDISAYFDIADQYQMKALEIIPSQLKNITSTIDQTKIKSIETLVLTGEKLESTFVNQFFELNPNIEIINTYGQTECSDVTTFYRITEKIENEKVLIGIPIQNTKMYVLDSKKLLCPIGVIGEIYTSGLGVSKGYLNKPELTQEKFIESPFSEGEMLFKTGDLGKWLSNGNIEIIGRFDDQVKIRGHRVELGEIEEVLEQTPSIRRAIVLFGSNETEEEELKAYFLSEGEQNRAQLRSYLKGKLPDYMIPVTYFQIEEFPLLSNGKIDKKSLLSLKVGKIKSGNDYISPRNEIEERLVKIWEEVLGCENIGIKDDFFELGGHSIKAIKVLFKINEEFNTQLMVDSIFNSPTIELLASNISFIKKQTELKLGGKNLKELVI